MRCGDLLPQPLALGRVGDVGGHGAPGTVAQGHLDVRLGPQVEQPVGVPVVAAAGGDDDDRVAVADLSRELQPVTAALAVASRSLSRELATEPRRHMRAVGQRTFTHA